MKTRLIRRASAGALALTLIGATAAVADNTVADGDGLTPVAARSLDLGAICTGVLAGDTALVAVSRNGNYGSTNVFKAGTSVTVTVLTTSGAGLNASITPSGTIAIPSDWDDADNNTMTSAVTSNVSLTSSVVGSFEGSVTYRSTGISSKDGSELTRDETMSVTATVENCQPSDSTPPTIGYTLNPSGPNGSNGWYTSDVTLTWTVTENESPGSLVESGCVDQTISADQDETTYSCSATSDGGSAGPVEVKIKRDATAPTVSLVGGPANGASYYFGSVPSAPSCNASDAMSGLDGACSASGYSAAVGTHTVSASAKDIAGNLATVSSTYTVLAWDLGGFYQPVDMGANVWNTVKGGSTVPLKFEVFAGATELTDTAVVDNFTVRGVACPVSGVTTDDIELTATGGTSLRYDATAGQFVQNWQTPKKPGVCYTVTMTTDDGSFINANFKLK